MRKFIALIGLFVAVCVGEAGAVTMIVVNRNDDPAGQDCDVTVYGLFCSLRQAIFHAAPGDTIEFAPGLSSPIRLNGTELLIRKALTIVGPGAGKLTISAQNQSRVLNLVQPDNYQNIGVSVSGVTLADGFFQGNSGGDNSLQDANGNGLAGGAGHDGFGGCVNADPGMSLTISGTAVRHCAARGGQGGHGAPGKDGSCGLVNPDGSCNLVFAGGKGGIGGQGGAAWGGAIAGALHMDQSSVIDGYAIAGSGGTGGNGGRAGFKGGTAGTPGGGGDGGSAKGGAISASGADPYIRNSTVAISSAVGGSGGDAATSAGAAGKGGNAEAGLFEGGHVWFSTVGYGLVEAGIKGSVGNGGNPGITGGSALGGAAVTGTIVVGIQPNVGLCKYQLSSPDSPSFSEDASCSGDYSFFVRTTLAQELAPLDESAPLPNFMPTWGSPLIDSGSCFYDFDAYDLVDQNGTFRPQGALCDAGAIETDYVFSGGGFEQQAPVN